MSTPSTKLAWAGELVLLEAKWTDKDGYTVKLKIATPNEARPNPFKEFTKRRGGKVGTVFYASMRNVQEGGAGYDGELMLLGWGDTNSQGYTVAFQLADVGEHHPFKGCARGLSSWMVALAEVSDEGKAVDQAQRERVEKQTPGRKQQTLSSVAAMLCANPRFWQWINDTQLGSAVPRVFTVYQAADWMRDTLGVDSRRDLDTMDGKAKMFHEKIRLPFVEWDERGSGQTQGARPAAVDTPKEGAVGGPGQGRRDVRSEGWPNF